MAAAPRRAKTKRIAPSWRAITILRGTPEVGNTYAHGVIGDHDLAEAHDYAAHQNVDVLSGGTGHADEAAFIERKNLANGHNAPVELDFDLDRHFRDLGDLFPWSHGRS